LEGPAAVCSVVATTGSTPRKVGAAMVVIADGTHLGRIEGTIGGGAVEHRVRKAAVEVIATTRPLLKDFALTTELGMCCGGQMSIFIESIQENPPLLVFGAGHVGTAVCRLANHAGFYVSMADPRNDLLQPERLPEATQLFDGYAKEDMEQMPFGPNTFVLVVTHDHPTDQRLVEDILSRPFCYLAMIGSKRKAEMTKERCRNKGFEEEKLRQLHSPAGIDIGAETPEEIAVSIVAEMIAHRRLGRAPT
jgi:xanthine dehydrogenase accessory factor